MGDLLLKGIGAMVVVAFIFVIVAVLFTIPVYYLWNWLVPSIFGLRAISFGEAWGLLVLSGFFFKSSVSKKD